MSAGSDGDGDSACSRETDQHKNGSSRDHGGSDDREGAEEDNQEAAGNQKQQIKSGSDLPVSKTDRNQSSGSKGQHLWFGSGTATGTATVLTGLDGSADANGASGANNNPGSSFMQLPQHHHQQRGRPSYQRGGSDGKQVRNMPWH